MKKEITTCDICDNPYDPAKEADEPMHRVGLSDPPPMDEREMVRLDTELKVIAREIKNKETHPQAKEYYEERYKILKGEVEKRQISTPQERMIVDLVCHTCFKTLQDYVRSLKKV